MTPFQFMVQKNNLKTGLIIFSLAFCISCTYTAYAPEPNPSSAPSAINYSNDTLTVEQGSATISSLPPIVTGSTPVLFSINSSSQLITINKTTGVISVTSGLSTGTYTINVTVFNTAGSKTFNNALIIKVVVPSALSYNPNTITIADNTSANSVVPQYRGSQTISSYELISSPNNSAITINNSTGIIHVAPHSTPGSYSLTVTAINSSGAATTNYTINVSPSFTLDILPIMTGNCTTCHNGSFVITNYNTYTTVSSDISNILFYIQQPVGNGQMLMPQGAPPLSTAEINTIKAWQATGMAQ